MQEEICSILGSARSSAESGGTPREFAHSCALSPHRHGSALPLASTSKRKEDPLMPNFSLQSKFHGRIPPRAAWQQEVLMAVPARPPL